MPQRVTAYTLAQAGRDRRVLDRPLEHRLVQVMPPPHTIAIPEGARRRKHVAPAPLARHIWVLSLQRLAKARYTDRCTLVAPVQRLAPRKPPPERHHTALGQRRPAVLPALPRSNHDFATVQIHILHAKRHTLGHTEATAVHQHRAQTERIAQLPDQHTNLAL